MNLEELYEKGFTFGRIKPSKELLDKIYSLAFSLENVEKNHNVQASLGECKISLYDDIALELKTLLCEATDDEELKATIWRMGFMASKFSKGDFINLHRDHRKHRGSDLHMNIWLPREKYKGRDFIYGTKEKCNRMHPELGDVVIITNKNDGFIHGVTPFEDGEPNISINGYEMMPDFNDIDELNMSCTYYGTTDDLLNGFVGIDSYNKNRSKL